MKKSTLQKVLPLILIVVVALLSGCSTQIKNATDPTEKVFFQICDVFIFAGLTTLVLDWVLDWFNIKIQRSVGIAIFIVLIFIYAYVRIFGTV